MTMTIVVKISALLFKSFNILFYCFTCYFNIYLVQRYFILLK